MRAELCGEGLRPIGMTNATVIRGAPARTGYYLSTNGNIRRGLALVVCGELVFLLGALTRPLSGEL